MKKLFNLLLVSTLLLSMTSCMKKVPAGHAGVKVYLLGTDKGVSAEELGVGRYFIGFNEDLFVFPTFTQNYVYTSNTSEGKTNDESITFQTVESMSIRTNVGVAYHIDQANVVKVFQKYREGVEEITAIPLRNEIRNAMINNGSKYTVERILGVDKVAFMKAVSDEVTAKMGKVGITIENVSLVGDLEAPENVRRAINAKIQATQDAVTAENQIREAYALAKKDSVLAAGKNKANHQLEQSLSPQLLQKMWIERWDGKLPTVASGSANSMILPSDLLKL